MAHTTWTKLIRMMTTLAWLSTHLVPRAQAAPSADFVAPTPVWEARVPGPSCPTTCSYPIGLYAEPGLGLNALRRHAALTRPDNSNTAYSQRLGPIPFNAGEYDTDGDGQDERLGFAHTFIDRFPSRRHCRAYTQEGIPRGWDSALSNGNVLLYEREPRDTLDALESEAFLQSASQCATRPEGERVFRSALPAFQLNLVSGRACPVGTSPTFLLIDNGGCRDTGGIIPERNLGAQCPALSNGSNPVNAVTGNKYQRERDYAGTARGHLGFERHYNSQSVLTGVLGPRWTHTYERRLVRHCVRKNASTVCTVRAYRDDGRVLTFVQNGNAWQATATVTDTLVETGVETYELRAADGAREHYALHGPAAVERARFRLGALTDAAGVGVSLAYDARNRVQRVVAPGDRALTLHYDARGRLAAIEDPAGARYRYEYDAQDNLVGVSYPAETGQASPVRRYVYEDSRDPSALTGIIDERGERQATWRYDDFGRAVLSEHAGGTGRVTFDYQGSHTRVTDAHGQERSFNITVEGGVGLISAVTGANCTICGPGYRAATQYDTRGLPQIVTDATGTQTLHAHDAAGRETLRTEAVGLPEARSLATSYDAVSGLPATIELRDAQGSAVWRSTRSYARNLLRQREDRDLLAPTAPGAVRATRYTYFGDAADDPPALNGLLRVQDGPREDVDDRTHFGYAPATGDLVSITNALGHRWHYAAHDAHGRPQEMTDPNGVLTRLRWHPRGWLLSREVAGALTRYSYDAAGLLTQRVDADGVVRHFAYDAAQRLQAISDGAGNARVFTLDALGNRVRESIRDANGTVQREFERHYDNFNRLAAISGANGQRVTYERDANGRPTRIIRHDPATASTREEVFTWDALGRQRQRFDATGAVSVRTHGLRNELLSFTDAAGVVTLMRYNAHGDLISHTSPDSGMTVYEVDELGNRRRSVDADGRDLRHTWDALGRQVSTQQPDGSLVQWRYDEVEAGPYALGHLTTRIDAAGTLRLRYDAHGNELQRERTAGSRTLLTSRTYTAADRLASLRYPSGRVLRYGRDAEGRIAGVYLTPPGAAETTLIEDVRYQPFGGPSSLVYGNGVRMSREVDRDYRLIRLSYSGIFARRYHHDAFDDLREVVREDGGAASERYAYDAASRLTAALGPWGDWAWQYDANGNRERARRGTQTDTLRYLPGTNRLDAILGADGLPDLAYGTLASGRVARRGAYAFTYGGDGRLTRVLHEQALSDYTLTHDADGALAFDRRVTRDGTRRTDRRQAYLEDADGRLIHIDTRSTQWTADGREDSASSEELVYLDDWPVARLGQTTLWYLHPDHQGTPLAASLADGTPAGGAALPPFIGASPPAFHLALATAYPGQRLLRAGAVLAHNGWREYDPVSGRFLQADPLGPAGGDNPYVYAANNPLRWTDPSGLAIWLCSRSAHGMPGNHAYLWDDRGNGRSCGRSTSAGHAPGAGEVMPGTGEAGPPTDTCTRVAGSDGWEDAIMGCCTRNANNGTWLPFVNDCQNAAHQCLEGVVPEPPPVPSGRFGASCAGDC